MGAVTFSVFRGEPDQDGDPFGKMVDYTIDLDEGMVVLDAIHSIQAEFAPDLACRWNCNCLLYTSPSPRDRG